MSINDKVSSGLKGFDAVIDNLRLGDNVVWKVDSVSNYKKMVNPFVKQACLENRKLIYVRFALHEPLLDNNDCVKVYQVDAGKGFESFTSEIYNLVEQEGKKAFYVFDCLTDLLESWHSDLMIGNFFKIICPFLFTLDTIAYFALIRNIHTFSTIAGIRETTQLLLELYQMNEEYYIHPLKVWHRYSPTMFFPHLIKEQEAISITASSEAAALFANMNRSTERFDFWDIIINKAKESLESSPEEQEKNKRFLMSMLMGKESGVLDLCNRYFTLQDILSIAYREVGTGFIGGKSVGMLVARKILERDKKNRFKPYMEAHDSYYLGSDIFYTYIVQNGWWELRTKQKTMDGYFKYAPELKEKLLSGVFPEKIQEKFLQMLEYFGQSPIIVRSSSLLEDNFGNAFAGKYDSVFCVNQGTPEERYEAFEQAVRFVYASTMNEDALSYRINRGLFDKDEQMAILVQRVSGDYYQEDFFPHLAGVGNSSNLYVWDKNTDMNAGMLRLVFGLGTRAVDRTTEDYAKIICLDNPLRTAPMHYEDKNKYTQHNIDILSLKENILTSKSLEEVFSQDLKTDKGLFVSLDYETADRLREIGYKNIKPSYILDFHEVIKETHFPLFMKEMLAVLSDAYDYPVDIEFTANFIKDKSFKVNLLQCRPLQTRGLGKSVKIPDIKDESDCFFFTKGNFMGGNVHLPIDYVVFVHPKTYLELNEQDKYEVARHIGMINSIMKGKNAMLIGPGRWGTTTPSLGVPIHFSEICNMSVICEVASIEEGFSPELSYGSHFFQDLVEAGNFYIAIFNGYKDVIYYPEYILRNPNILESILPESMKLSHVIHIAVTEKMELFSDVISQKLLCR